MLDSRECSGRQITQRSPQNGSVKEKQFQHQTTNTGLQSVTNSRDTLQKQQTRTRELQVLLGLRHVDYFKMTGWEFTNRTHA